MDEHEFYMFLMAARRYGGSFVSNLAVAWGAADSGNKARLAMAFPDIVEKYGPGSYFYDNVARERVAVVANGSAA